MFRESFKYYKRKNPTPDLSQVLRIDKNNEFVEVINTTQNIDLKNRINENNLGLMCLEKWDILKIKNKPGLIFIKNPFTAKGQRYWIKRCLKDFSHKPYRLNIDAHNLLNPAENWWHVCTDLNDNRRLNLSTKLRWSTLGYHHNWDTKVYSETSKDEFPEDLADLCAKIAILLQFNNFKAEAAIVNYYFMNSTLSGHTDHSESNLEAPLFSFSFGQSAIFLIGGLTENDPAVPLFVDSGDIIIMSKESRLCYHAVPKILRLGGSEPWNQKNELQDDQDENNDWNDFDIFIKSCRLNINVRQVLKPGEINLKM